MARLLLVGKREGKWEIVGTPRCIQGVSAALRAKYTLLEYVNDEEFNSGTRYKDKRSVSSQPRVA